MKRLILSLVAAAALAGPLSAAPSVANAEPKWERHRDRDARREWRDDRKEARRDWREDRRDERREWREDWRAERSWDRARHNGYYYNNRWFYGPPPQSYYASPYYRPGYTAWRRGAYLPPAYRGYVVRDYQYYHLRPPPRGYAWYRVGDDYLLATIASGLIFDIIAD